MKVKEFPNWQAIHFNGRTVTRDDARFLSAEQMERLLELEVILVERHGKQLIVENK